MTASRIKDPTLSTRINAGQLAWQRYVTPITEHYCRQIAKRDYRGKKLACWQHITLNIIPSYPAHLEREIAERSIQIHHQA